MRIRALTIVGVLALALGLVGVTLALAQNPAPAPDVQPASERIVAALETNPGPLTGVDGGARRITEPEIITPAVTLTKTVGLDSNACANTLAITVTNGTEVTYCYEVTNTGTVTLTRHSLDDDKLGGILNDFNYTLAPGASAFMTTTTSITGTTVNTATWTAYNPGPTDLVTATAVATVTVLIPEITLEKTVGLDPNICATTSVITTTAGTDATYCYKVTNTGSLTVTRHSLDDDKLGGILNDFNYTLAPGGSAFITATAPITGTTINTATWTAYNPGPTDVVTATAEATVNVPGIPSIELTKTVGTDPETCATTTGITVISGTAVTYCYEVVNTGSITLTLHDLDDSALGNVLNDFSFTLGPGATTSVTQTVEITHTTINTATWTAYNPGPTDVVTATAVATVTVTPTAPEINVAPPSLSAELLPASTITSSLTIANSGNGNLAWSVYFAPFDCDDPGALLWASADPVAGITLPGDEDEVVVTFTSVGSSPGNLDGVLCVESNDADEPVVAVPLNLTVGMVRSFLPSVHRP